MEKRHLLIRTLKDPEDCISETLVADTHSVGENTDGIGIEHFQC